MLWAGKRRTRQPVRLALKAHFDAMEFGIETGLPHSHSQALAHAVREQAGKPARRVAKIDGDHDRGVVELTGEYRDLEAEG